MKEADLWKATAWEMLPGQPLAPVLRYFLSLLILGLAWFVRHALDPILGDAQVFPTFYVAVALVAWWAGWRPAVLVVLLGYVAGDWFFLSPRYSLGVNDWKHIVELATYFSVSGISILCITSWRVAARRARASTRALENEKKELEVQIRKREQIEAALARTQQELERLVKERTARLQDTVEDLEQFSYSITHDMRAPLRAMQSYASMLGTESAGALSPRSLEFLRRISEASNRMDKLIQDSLNYTKILREELPVRPMDLAALLRGLISTYPNLQPPKAEIHVEFATLRVLGNESAFTQVFSNLLGNAVKFVAPGVKPSVRVWAEKRARSPAPSLRETQADTSVARVWVEDNGIGIPRVAHEKIFGMFQRLHSESEYPGTGIGLAVVRKALERVGGRIGLESQPGKGSRFWVEAPLASSSPPLQ